MSLVSTLLAKRRIWTVFIAVHFVFFGGFFSNHFANNKVDLLGAGATFPYPYYDTLFQVYSKLFPVRINYQSIGSGGGIQQLKQKTVDFGASDAFLSDKELASMP